MVSQLSARLLNGYSSGNSSSSSVNTISAESNQRSNKRAARTIQQLTSGASAYRMTTTNMSSGGYMADIDSSTSSGPSGSGVITTPPFYIGLLPGHRKREGGGLDSARSTKRREVLETEYLASTATRELSRAGRTARVVRSTSKVQLVSSSKMMSPFLIQRNTPSNGFHDDYSTSISDAVQACGSFYKMLPPAVVATGLQSKARSESTTGSVSNDDSLDGNDEKLQEVASFLATPSSMTMGEALSISTEARLITLSAPPFMVVHLNAAFTRLTGMSSASALGHPFHELLNDDALVSELQSPCDPFALTTIHGKAVTVKSSADRTNAAPYSISVSPVGPKPVTATHYTLQLQETTIEEHQLDLNRKPLPAPVRSLAVLG